MKRKGFTLIELLAVIVILAIIALIATPIVMNVIENARKGAAERSIENYLRAVDTAIMTEKLNRTVENGTYEIQDDGSLCIVVDGTTDCGQSQIMVEVSGDKPDSGGIVVIENNKVVSALTSNPSQKTTVSIGDYTVEYNEEGKLEATKKGAIEESIQLVQIDSINLYNKDELQVGKYNANTTGNYASNANYIATGYMSVTPGDTIYYDAYLPDSHIWFSEDSEVTTTRYTKFNARYITAFDSDKKVITDKGCDSTCTSGTYVVPEGVSYIVITLPNLTQNVNFHPISTYDNIMISTTPITEYVPYNGNGYYEAYAYLPQKINVAVGKELKLYNNNIVPKSLKDSKLTFKWNSDIGTKQEDGLNISATSKDIGQHNASLLIYYENKLINRVSTTINVVDNTIASEISLLPIGDSLTNNKKWEYHIVDYSGQKISLVGTRSYNFGGGITIGHEGISGTTAIGYYSSATTSGSTNNFYNSEVGHFDYGYYKTQNNINPNGVILFLGTNGLYPYKEEIGLESIDNIITEIKSDDSNAEIYLVTPTIRGNQSYYYNLASLYYLKYYEDKYGNDSKIHIVPLVLTVDSYDSFDDGDDVHPNESGYVEFANTIYASISANN